MKALQLTAGALVALGAVCLPLLAHTYPTGAPPGFSGPERACNLCHNSFALNSGTGDVSILAPATFVAGEVVPITVSITNTTPEAEPGSRRQGFEVSARDAADTDVFVDSFVVDDVTVQRVESDGAYVTHTLASVTDTSWSFAWVAPAEGTPDAVTIYVAGNAANGNDGTSGDYIYTDSLTLTRTIVAAEDAPEPPALELGPVAPNPVRATARATYTLARPTRVAARLLDGRGRTVRLIEAGARAAGAHTLVVDAEGLAAGTYFLAVETPQGRRVRPVAVAR